MIGKEFMQTQSGCLEYGRDGSHKFNTAMKMKTLIILIPKYINFIIVIPLLYPAAFRINALCSSRSW